MNPWEEDYDEAGPWNEDYEDSQPQDRATLQKFLTATPSNQIRQPRTFGPDRAVTGIAGADVTPFDPNELLGIQDPFIAAAQGVVDLGESAVGLTSLPTFGATGKLLEKATGYDPDFTREWLGEFYSPAHKRAQEEVGKARGFLGTSKALLQNPSVIGETITRSLPVMGGGAALGRGVAKVAPRLGSIGAAGVGEGAAVAGLAAEDFRKDNESGFLAPKEAALATTIGLSTALIGALGGKVSKYLGVDDFDVLLTKGRGTPAQQSVAMGKLLKGAASEGLQEVGQESLEQIQSNIAKDRPWNEGVSEAAAQALFAGLGMGAGANVAGPLMSGRAQSVLDEQDIIPPQPDATAVERAAIEGASPQRRLGVQIPDTANILADPQAAQLADQALREAQSPIQVPGRTPAIDLLRNELLPPTLAQVPAGPTRAAAGGVLPSRERRGPVVVAGEEAQRDLARRQGLTEQEIDETSLSMAPSDREMPVSERSPISKERILGELSAMFGGNLKKRQAQAMLENPNTELAVKVAFQEAFSPSHWRNVAADTGVSPEEAYNNSLQRGVEILNQARRAAGMETSLRLEGVAEPVAQLATRLQDPANRVSTNDAVTTGIAADSVSDLQHLSDGWKQWKQRLDDLKSQAAKDPAKMMEYATWAQRGQLYREAVEAATSSGSHKVEARTTEFELGLPEPKLDWRKNPQVADWLVKNGPAMNIDVSDVQAAGTSLSQAAPTSEITIPSKSEVQSIVDQLQKDYPSAAPVVVVENYHELPDSTHQAAYRQGGNPVGINGAVSGGKVYIVSNNLESAEEARQIWLHEQAGHFATDKLLGPKLQKFMEQVADSFADSELMTDTKSRYKNASKSRLGREFVARLAENPQAAPNLWNRIVAQFREWLRSIGWVKQVSENDIRVLLNRSMESLAKKAEGMANEDASLSLKTAAEIAAERYPSETVQPQPEQPALPRAESGGVPAVGEQVGAGGEAGGVPPAAEPSPLSPGEKTKPSKGKWFAGLNPVETKAMMQERADAFQQGKSDQQIIEDVAKWMSGDPNIKLDGEAANFVVKDLLAKLGKQIKPTSKTVADEMQRVQNWQQIDRLSEMARRIGEQSGRELVSRRLAYNDINWLMPVLSWRGLAQKTWRKQLGLTDEQPVTETVTDAATGKARIPKLEGNEKIADLGRKFQTGEITQDELMDGIAKELGLPSLNGETATKLMELAQQAEAKPEGVLRNKILQQMVDTIQRTTPASPFDIIRDYWYNNALSGSRTLAAILTGSWVHGAVMATQEALDAALLKGRPVVGARILQAYMTDTLEGLANAVDVFTTGDYTRRAEFAENMHRAFTGRGKLDSLEGWLKHGKLWQKALGLTSFVRRAVIGLDYVGAIATRGSGVIYNAMLDNPQQLEEAMKRFDKQANEAAKKQAVAELGKDAKWVDRKARQLEILEEGISEENLQKAAVLGEIAALNADPVGALGALVYKPLEGMARAIQKFTGASRDASQFAAFTAKAAAGLAFARAAINMTQNASNWIPLVGGVNWARALLGKKLPPNHWARTLAVMDGEGNPLSDDRRRLVAAAQGSGLALAAIAYAMTQAGDDDDKEKFDVQGSWHGLTPQQRKDKMAAGQRPLSIQIAGKNIRYENFPFAGALAVIGNIRDKERKDGKRMDAGDAIQRLTDGWASGLFYMKDLGPISGFSQALGVSAYNNDEGAEALNRWAAQQSRTAGALIPFGSLVREVDTFFDPAVYKPSSGLDYWIRGIPFVRRAVGEGPEYNMAGLPVDNMLTPQSRFLARPQDDKVVEVLSNLIAKGVFPKHPSVAPVWFKDGERKSASDFPKETYKFQVETLKAWREIMLEDYDYLKDITPEDYEDYFKRYLAPVRDEIKREVQDEIDPDALDNRGRVRKYYMNEP